MGVVSTEESKATLRASLRASRATRSNADRASAGDRIARHVRELVPATPTTITAYLSMPTEPGTHLLIADAIGDGHRVLLPRIAGQSLEWVAMTAATTLARGPLGIREPAGPDEGPSSLAAARLMLLPALAVDRTGRRLGQGGGFYDRVLEKVPSLAVGGPLRLAVVFDDEVLESVPAQSHDCIVDGAVTPSGLVWFTPTPQTVRADRLSSVNRPDHA